MSDKGSLNVDKSILMLTYFLFKFWNDIISTKKNSDGECKLFVQDDFVRLTMDVLGECILGYNFDLIEAKNNITAKAFADIFTSADIEVGNKAFRLLNYVPFNKEALRLKEAYKIASKAIKQVKISNTSQLLSSSEFYPPKCLQETVA